METTHSMRHLFKVSAPAKAILCGQHAVVYGQDAIAFGVDLKCIAHVYSQNNKQKNIQNKFIIKINLQQQLETVYFADSLVKASQKFNKVNKKQQIQGFNLVQVDYTFQQFLEASKIDKQQYNPINLTTLYKLAIFCSIFNINSIQFNDLIQGKQYLIQTSSQIPIGKGLGSSASFNSVLAASLLIIFNILKRQDFQKNQNHKPLINYVSKVFQKVQHGRPSGIDNFVSVNGGLVLFNKSKNPQFKLISNQNVSKRLTQELSIGFIDSGIQKNTKLAVNRVLQKYSLHLNGQEKYKNMIETIGTFPDKIISLLSSQSSDQQQIKNKFFQILALNHFYLRQLGLSNETIQQIVMKFTVSNKSVAKITGAGMGGVVMVVGDKQFMNQLHKQKQLQKYKIIVSRMNNKGLQVEFQ